MLEEFYNIFGPELKAVTGDPKRIEDVLVRVGLLVEPIEQVSQCCHSLTNKSSSFITGITQSSKLNCLKSLNVVIHHCL